MGSVQIESYDVLIIGAGLSGVCSIYHLSKRFPSWNIKVIEAADSVGGTWYWNRQEMDIIVLKALFLTSI